MKLSPAEIGRAIRAAREGLGWTQAKLADGVGTTQQTIEKIEGGKVRRSSYIHDIVQILDLDFKKEQLPPSIDQITALPMGQRVAAMRKELDLSIAQVSELTGFPEISIQNVEDGGMQPDAAELARALLSTLDSWSDTDKLFMPVSPDELTGRSYSAFPAGKMTFPYYVTGRTKGIRLAFYSEHPLEVSRLMNVGGLIISGDWVKGGPGQGDRIYFKAMPDHRHNRLASAGVSLVFRLNELPEEIEDIRLVEIVGATPKIFAVKSVDGSIDELSRDEWGLLEVIGMFTRPRPKK